MKTHEAERLRQAWRERGSLPCEHCMVVHEQEELFGGVTGQYVCMECGAYVRDLEGRLLPEHPPELPSS